MAPDVPSSIASNLCARCSDLRGKRGYIQSIAVAMKLAAALSNRSLKGDMCSAYVHIGRSSDPYMSLNLLLLSWWCRRPAALVCLSRALALYSLSIVAASVSPLASISTPRYSAELTYVSG